MARKKKLPIIKNPDHKAQAFCFGLGYKISPEPVGNNYKIYYQKGTKQKYLNNGELFSADKVYQEIWNLYKKLQDYEQKKVR
tara:strand:+ start:395 stop:640 length:246 start_codon:yes stop_codon:yes gene_type:complete